MTMGSPCHWYCAPNATRAVFLNSKSEHVTPIENLLRIVVCVPCLSFWHHLCHLLPGSLHNLLSCYSTNCCATFWVYILVIHRDLAGLKFMPSASLPLGLWTCCSLFKKCPSPHSCLAHPCLFFMTQFSWDITSFPWPQPPVWLGAPPLHFPGVLGIPHSEHHLPYIVIVCLFVTFSPPTWGQEASFYSSGIPKLSIVLSDM